MANISTNLSDWSATAGSNQPDSSDTNTIQADLQAIQAAVKGAFPNVTGAVNATHTELNYVDGVTSAIQTQLNAKAASGANGDITSLTAVTNITAAAVTVATDDKVLIQDTSATDQIKTVTAQSIADLVSVPDASETVKGKVELATDAEAQAFTADKFIDGAKLNTAFKGSNQSLATSGYQKLPGGLIIQWGEATPSASGIITVTLPIAYTTAHLQAYGTSGANNATNTGFVATNSLTTTNFEAINVGDIGSGENIKFRWLSIGY